MFSCLKLYGLPGGEQVDGLPPAASSGAGVGGRRRVPARVCDLRAVFDNFLCYSYGQIFSNQFFALRYVKL